MEVAKKRQIPVTTPTLELLEGQYPNVEQLMPQQFDKVVTIDRAALIQVLERLAIVAERFLDVVALTIGKTEITLAVRGQGLEFIACELVGEEIRIGFK